MISSGFDRLIHPEQRLRICAALRPLAEASFQSLREELEISDSALSKQIRTLNEAGYLDVVKESNIPRPRTWVSLTVIGRRALEQHLAWLRDVASETDLQQAHERQGQH